MKTIFKLTGITLALIATMTINAQTNWGFDKDHTNIRFTVSHLVISEVDGNFSSFDGEVTTKGDDFSNADISFSIDVNSISTDNDSRDKHLKSEDFFNVAAFPKIEFTSTSMKKTGESTYKLSGDLKMHGVTLPVTLEVKHNGTVKDPWGNTKAGFKLSGEVDRTKWGLVYNSTLETGGLMIGEDVEIVCNVELVQK